MVAIGIFSRSDLAESDRNQLFVHIHAECPG